MKIKTDRLVIRNFRRKNAGELKDIAKDFNCSEYAVYDRPLPENDEDVKTLAERFARSKTAFAVYREGEMIGYAIFHKVENGYDVGYCFHSSFHGKGYAFESLKALINYFADKFKVDIFTAGTALKNAPSCRLLEKLGFQCVSEEQVSFDGKFYFQGGNFVLKI